MANGNDTEQVDEPQLDEFGEPIPTEEELLAQQHQQEQERASQAAKTDQTLKLVGASAMLEQQLPNTLPTQGAVVPPLINRGGQQYAGTPMPALGAMPPVSQGRMYMGPTMNAPQEAAFMQSPVGTNQNLMPPPTPEQSAGAGDRVAAATVPPPLMAPPIRPEQLAAARATDTPYATTIGMHNEAPYSDASMQTSRNAMIFGLQQKLNSGQQLTPEEIQAALGTSVGYRAPARPLKPVGQPEWVPANPATGAPGYFKTGTGTVHLPKVIPPLMQTETLKYDAVKGKLGSPEHKFFGFGKTIPAVPEIPDQPARTVTRKIPLEPPTATGTTPQPTATSAKSASKGALTKDQARTFLKQAGGDKAKARQLARDAGYEL